MEKKKINWILIISIIMLTTTIISIAIPNDNDYCEENSTWICSWLK
jgi:hypothetical protein